MQKNPIIFFLAIFFLLSCKKEHLDPESPSTPGSTDPVVYIHAKLDNDSVYFAGGVDGYEGVPAVLDTNNNRFFNFTLLDPLQPASSYFKFSINNYSTIPGNPQSDLDSTIYPGTRLYGGGLFFMPLAAAISWTDASGTEYKSTPVAQNIFEIHKVEDVIFQSKKYKKTELSFECALVHNFTDTIHLTGGEATVLFSAE